MSIDAKILNKILQNKSNNTFKGSYTIIKRDLFQGCKDLYLKTNQFDIPTQIEE